jgi:hypothetical protein
VIRRSGIALATIAISTFASADALADEEPYRFRLMLDASLAARAHPVHTTF